MTTTGNHPMMIPNENTGPDMPTEQQKQMQAAEAEVKTYLENSPPNPVQSLGAITPITQADIDRAQGRT